MELFAFGSVIAVSLISLVGAATLFLKPSLLQRGLFLLVSLAVGALFGDALIHLLPESFEEMGNPLLASSLALGGIMVFLLFEKFLHWHHAHGHGTADHLEESVALAEKAGAGEPRIKPIGWLVLFSDGIHNFIDGILIGASYLISIEVGIATTIAIALHEIPHEISDFGLLIHAGFSRARALFMNLLSALTAVVGTAFALIIGTMSETLVPFALAFGAGAFLYIAGSDLVPELHKTTRMRDSFFQFMAILLGIALMFALLVVEG